MSRRLPQLTPGEVERALIRRGFYLARSKGSHRLYKHPDEPRRRVVVSFHPGNIKRGTLARIIKDAGLSVEEFLGLLT